MNPLTQYLAPTTMCDADSPAIREAALEITRGARDDREAAVALFYWVRDEVAYTMGDWNWKASETLSLGRGTCSNKANLMVALARAIGIPAAFHVQYVAAPAYFSGGFIPIIRNSVRDAAIHVYVSLHIDGQWVKCDATDDKALSDAIEAIVPHAKAFDFDGRRDAVIPFKEGSVLSDQGPFADIDADLNRAARISPAHKRMFGAAIEFMRTHGRQYLRDCNDERQRMQSDFLAYLAKTAPEVHSALVAVPGAVAA